MNNDPIIQELREIRKNIEEECQQKGQTYFEHLLEVQEKFKERITGDSLDSEHTMKKTA